MMMGAGDRFFFLSNNGMGHLRDTSQGHMGHLRKQSDPNVTVARVRFGTHGTLRTLVLYF